ncbi:MAG: hypothetical protein M1337_06940 [Actinobacteria bacterium]|nr:hypothetical protein [Actinomycetota bacterium]
MPVSSAQIEVTRQGVPPLLIDASIMVDGQPSTRCLQQVWCSPQVLGPTTHVEADGDEARNTTCLRQLRLPPGFTPLVE